MDSTDGAAVRITMTAGNGKSSEGELNEVVDENELESGEHVVDLLSRVGKISPNLKIGANLTASKTLLANQALSSKGVMLIGLGFLINKEQAAGLGLGVDQRVDSIIYGYRNGKDISQKSRNLKVIDLNGLAIDAVRDQFPKIYQHVLTQVKPERDLNREKSRRENWWLFGRKNTDRRNAIEGLSRFISTIETSKHRFFVFLDKSTTTSIKLFMKPTDGLTSGSGNRMRSAAPATIPRRTTSPC